MKLLVNMIQLAIVAAIILPVLYIWETDKVDKFCQKITTGMSQETYLDLVEQDNVKLVEVVGDDVLGGQWHAIVKTHLPWLDYQCQTNGVSKLVVTADIVKSEKVENDEQLTD
jgi:hypothetical protein